MSSAVLWKLAKENLQQSGDHLFRSKNGQLFSQPKKWVNEVPWFALIVKRSCQYQTLSGKGLAKNITLNIGGRKIIAPQTVT